MSVTLPGTHSFCFHTLHMTVAIPDPGFMLNLGPDEAPQLVPAASLLFIHPQVYLLSATNCVFWTLSQVLGELQTWPVSTAALITGVLRRGSCTASGKGPLANIQSHSRLHQYGRGLGGVGRPLQLQGLSQPSSCAQAGSRITWSATPPASLWLFFLTFCFVLGYS